MHIQLDLFHSLLFSVVSFDEAQELKEKKQEKRGGEKDKQLHYQWATFQKLSTHTVREKAC